jgi:hypothetical protein
VDHFGDSGSNGADEHGAERLGITSDDDNEFNEVLNSASRQFVDWNASHLSGCASDSVELQRNRHDISGEAAARGPLTL